MSGIGLMTEHISFFEFYEERKQQELGHLFNRTRHVCFLSDSKVSSKLMIISGLWVLRLPEWYQSYVHTSKCYLVRLQEFFSYGPG